MSSSVVPHARLARRPAAATGLRTVADRVYLLAIVAINFTLFRPSPVDVLFAGALVLSVCAAQTVTRNIFIYTALILSWTLSMIGSSLGLIDNPEVGYYIVKISYAVSIGLCSALVSAHWGPAELRLCLKAFVFSTVLAALLGTAGYLGSIDELVWDGRAKGFLDDPNMYGSFLLIGLLSCLFLLWEGDDRRIWVPAFGILLVGLTFSFSRAAVMSFAVWGGALYVFLNRRDLPRAVMRLLVVLVVVGAAVAIASASIDGVADRLADRSTIAKEYDLGHEGRYNRYALSVGFILDHPFGMGLLEWDKLFDEPIHNIWLSSFMNYGWIAGIAFTLLVMFSVAIMRFNFRVSGDPLLVAVSLAWLAVLSCAFLHEAERWRHLWLVSGLVWGLDPRRFRPAPERGTRPRHPQGASTQFA